MSTPTHYPMIDADINGPWHTEDGSVESWLVVSIPGQVMEDIEVGSVVMLGVPNELDYEQGGIVNRAVLMKVWPAEASAETILGAFRVADIRKASEITLGDIGSRVYGITYPNKNKTAQARRAHEYTIDSLYAHANGNILVSGMYYLKPDTEVEFI